VSLGRFKNWAKIGLTHQAPGGMIPYRADGVRDEPLGGMAYE
jgi:hypothetical protein